MFALPAPNVGAAPASAGGHAPRVGPETRAARLGGSRASTPLAGQAKGLAAPALLTTRQSEILHACVEAGYYTIPRKATLRQLAERRGISTTSLSLILRRAENKVILAFVPHPDGPNPAQGRSGNGHGGAGSGPTTGESLAEARP